MTTSEQERKDAGKLAAWKAALRGRRRSHAVCPDAVRDYLDTHLPNWRDTEDPEIRDMRLANEIVARAQARVAAGGNLLPRYRCRERPVSERSEELLAEHRDATRLSRWRHLATAPVQEYLDSNIPGWRMTSEEAAMAQAREIVERAQARVASGGSLLPHAFANN